MDLTNIDSILANLIDTSKEERKSEIAFEKALRNYGFDTPPRHLSPYYKLFLDFLESYFKEDNYSIDIILAYINGLSPSVEKIDKDGSLHKITFSSGKSIIDYIKEKNEKS